MNDLMGEEEEKGMIIGGDWNARTGRKEAVYLGEEEEESEGRNSKDHRGRGKDAEINRR